jgi:hypothetical protein
MRHPPFPRVSYPLFAALLISIISLTGCCNCPPRTTLQNPPPPITPEEQIRRLTEWSTRLPGLKAKTVLAGVRLDYRDDQGSDHSVNAEGTLQIRQHLENTALKPRSDVLLLGKSFDQPAFEAGCNAPHWWFAIRLDTKKAWLGDATKPLDYASLASKGAASILRADLVPDLLGLSPLPPNEINRNGNRETGGGPITMMLVNDATATNDLLIGQMSGDGRPFISREIVVDRISGHIVEVRLYDPAGVMAVRSRLSDYRPVSYEEGAPHAAVVPQFPRKVEVNYPAQHLTAALEFADVKVSTDFSERVFATPDFQGLQVIPAD